MCLVKLCHQNLHDPVTALIFWNLNSIWEKYFHMRIWCCFIGWFSISQSALYSLSILCQSFANILNNTYGVPIRLFITGEGQIVSTEGTTQSCYAMYALVITPLKCPLCQSQPDVSQVWYAYDVTAGDKLVSLFYWWKHLLAYGPLYGYSLKTS